MVSFPSCKINLGLQVVAKRSDGFHEIETCFYPVERTDILEIIPADEFSISYSGIKVPGNSEENICVRAYQLIIKDFKISPIKIHLHKIIPMGAGLGGGSSDAAFMLRSVNKLFDLQILPERLKEYAIKLGSDCAFFLEDVPKIGTGRGEILSSTSLSLKGKYLVIIKPDIHVSTADAYSMVSPRQSGFSILETTSLPISNWKDRLKNDFEETIFKKCPTIGKVKEDLYSLGAIYASMSGSGASVYGIFESPVELKENFPEMDYWSGELK